MRVDQYDELFVISDLHIGGHPGFQIFRQEVRLARFIEHLTKSFGKRRVGLVLNGDVIDTLADDINGYIAVDAAEAVLDNVFRNFTQVWDAVRGFIRAKNRHLVFILGNHDIELALPNVEASLRERLTNGDSAANGRIVFATRGSGYTCSVGGARVFCTHGNEVDPWNVVDNDALRRLAHKANLGRGFDRDTWEPNAGTKLVIDVMNHVKRQFPFVDLLKPEIQTVVPILLFLKPSIVWEVRKAGAIAQRYKVGQERAKLLGGIDMDPPQLVEPKAATQMPTIEELLGPRVRESLDLSSTAGSSSSSSDQVLRHLERSLQRGELSQAPAVDDDALLLGFDDVKHGVRRISDAIGLVKDFAFGDADPDRLRLALLDWLGDDRTFDFDRVDDTFRDVTARVEPNITYVCTGHTHLARARPIGSSGRRFYYNSGTWARLMRFSVELLENKQAFKQIFKKLEGSGADQLAEIHIPSEDGDRPLAFDRPTAIHISRSATGAKGRLVSVEDADGGVGLQSVVGSEHSWTGDA